MQLRLMREVFSNANDINFFLMIFLLMSLTCELLQFQSNTENTDKYGPLRLSL